MAVVKTSSSDIDLLARLLRAEAEGEGTQGMLMVGNVGINRIRANCSDFKGLRTVPQMVYQQKQFTKSLQELIPEVKEEDLIPAPTGVRAQALKFDGNMVHDFYIVQGKLSIHVCNAPSPEATASIEIGKEVVRRIPEQTSIIETSHIV